MIGSPEYEGSPLSSEALYSYRNVATFLAQTVASFYTVIYLEFGGTKFFSRLISFYKLHGVTPQRTLHFKDMLSET